MSIPWNISTAVFIALAGLAGGPVKWGSDTSLGKKLTPGLHS